MTYNDTLSSRPKVSIIIPFYNAEKHLHNCIKSLNLQSLQNCEFIFINDGSNDKSIEILEFYKRTDSRIIIISQKNQGPGIARNKGIKVAKGEYIGFMDCDDSIKGDMYYSLYNIGVETNSDIIISKTILERDNKYIIKESIFPPNQEYKQKFIQENIIPNLLEKEDLFAVWNKIYRTKFIKNKQILFPNNRFIEEDSMFNIAAFNLACKVYFTDYSGYFYKEIENSESRKIITSDLFSKAIQQYYFDYKSSFNLKLESDYVENLKFHRLFNRVCYLIFALASNKKYKFDEAFNYSKKMISNPILINNLDNKYSQNNNGIFEKIILKIIQKQACKSLYLLIKGIRIIYNPKLSELLRKINKSIH